MLTAPVATVTLTPKALRELFDLGYDTGWEAYAPFDAGRADHMPDADAIFADWLAKQSDDAERHKR